ncbi:MAG TPA: DUF4145 domain-containing protein [Terriglobia bacterium]|nr:DUF4145 domain-containing protein [Terriglobia bacterium]
MISTELVQEQTQPVQPSFDVFGFGERLAVLFSDWPTDMKLLNNTQVSFQLAGECPHTGCRKQVVFTHVGIGHTQDFHENLHGEQRTVGILKCPNCEQFILGIIRTKYHSAAYIRLWEYEKHYPIGEPEFIVPHGLPPTIEADFREALQCQAIGAKKSTVLMCRRALQTSCDALGAQGKDLFTQIDDLAAKGTITVPLKKMAHKIRLLGKRGAHDNADLDEPLTPADAEAAVRFMRHYFDHVYVFPSEMDTS